LRGGRFDQNNMIAPLKKIGAAGDRRRDGVMRIWANLEWAIFDCPGTLPIVEYESRVNDVLPKYDVAAVFAYDLTKFDASLTPDMLRTHPLAIIGGTLRENPFYVPPAEFFCDPGGRAIEIQ
jgi:hypothetical protein